ncbi:lipopolysaccharide biosynthesis protein [Parabacteroides segnis]|jgi:O-antigen/teichoic acid export membrane protein|uniref:Lipopolysaccharide biosynthesis protein n=1 Tax=Parabacteroides segnis TaxID=2763058 RepID=A0ABR7E4W9_9BACT|nr:MULTISPECIES: lipopolysaccharide biosynthesis protein [Parabacteroides]MBC5644790.1 lipopolysaccharide biosynthesis protein [Parabacteroides segnis]MCM0714508.1 lipopolysaccharide biosynthesis protein [Parabacteroides sp. TA-V-105]
MEQVGKEQAISNFSWGYMGKMGAQIISFGVTIVLARLIAPADFGLVAIVAIFTTFLNVFVDSGLGSALIQKENADNIDFSTVFFFNIVVSLLLYIILYISTPFISSFYDNTQLTPLLRVASFSLVITGFRSTQETFVTRNLLFKKHFTAVFIAAICSAVIGIMLAYLGYGAWAIVFQQLCNTSISTIVLWYLIPWRPKLLFSINRLKGLMPFGFKILGGSLMDTLYSEIRSLLIGKIYTPSDLAFYDRGKQFPYMIVSGINGALNSVLFPIMSRNQDNLNRVKQIVRKTIRISLFFVSSILCFLICAADSMVELLMTTKWLPSVIYIQVLCFDALLWPVITIHYNSFKAVGKSDLYLKYVTITKIIGMSMLIVSIPFGVLYVAVSSVLSMLIQLMMLAKVSRNNNNYLYKEQFKDLYNGVKPAILIFIGIWWVNETDLIPLFRFLTQGILTFVIVIVYAQNTNLESYEIIKDLWKKNKKRWKKK